MQTKRIRLWVTGPDAYANADTGYQKKFIFLSSRLHFTRATQTQSLSAYETKTFFESMLTYQVLSQNCSI